MTPSRSPGGISGVIAYEELVDGIAVRFRRGQVYLYTATSVGRDQLAGLRAAARRGEGLATYISRHVHDNHVRRLDDLAAWRAARP